MAEIYVSGIRVLENEVNVKTALTQVDPLRRAQAAQIKDPRKRAQSLAAGLLVQHAAREYLGENAPAGIYEILTTEQGKPYFKDFPDLHFSLSHSGQMVLVALSEQQVGADIQEWKELKADIAGRFFHPEETAYLRSLPASSSEKAFFDLWCLKESYIKYTGKGLSQPLDELDFTSVLQGGGFAAFEFTEDGSRIRAELIEVPHGYSAAVIESI
ncbi:MAG: 4'-phosphopantetheinyl transferase superfamily protein [Lachnospiraceae bacterium]|nr:4'-phosphopantetheinyl transferase superfamily protein [Lachnospiraceae bacterium]